MGGRIFIGRERQRWERRAIGQRIGTSRDGVKGESRVAIDIFSTRNGPTRDGCGRTRFR